MDDEPIAESNPILSFHPDACSPDHPSYDTWADF